MRADRLIQVLLLLQGRSRVTAAELAAELEVSVPTARRDLEALAMAGVPIYPTRGRGGGWRLIGGARTDLTGLTEGEVTALLVGLTQNRAAAPEHVAAIVDDCIRLRLPAIWLQEGVVDEAAAAKAQAAGWTRSCRA